MKKISFLVLAIALGACKTATPEGDNNSKVEAITPQATGGAIIYTVNQQHSIAGDAADPAAPLDKLNGLSASLAQLRQQRVCFASFNTPEGTLATGIYLCRLNQINNHNAAVFDTVFDTWAPKHDQLILIKDNVQVGRVQIDAKTKKWTLTALCTTPEFTDRCGLTYDQWKETFLFTMNVPTNFAEWTLSIDKDIKLFSRQDRIIDPTYLNGAKICAAKVKHPGGWNIGIFNCNDRGNLNAENFLILEIQKTPPADGKFDALPLYNNGSEVGTLTISGNNINLFKLCSTQKSNQKCQVHNENGKLSIQPYTAPAAN